MDCMFVTCVVEHVYHLGISFSGGVLYRLQCALASGYYAPLGDCCIVCCAMLVIRACVGLVLRLLSTTTPTVDAISCAHGSGYYVHLVDLCIVWRLCSVGDPWIACV
eukprot:3545542-Amphidinium_carterae.1